MPLIRWSSASVNTSIKTQVFAAYWSGACKGVLKQPHSLHKSGLPSKFRLSMLWSMNYSLYQSILEWNVRPSVQQLGRNWVMQQDNYPRCSSKFTTEWLTSQSPNLNLIKMLWWDFKKAVHKWMLADFNELKQRCKEEWPIQLNKYCTISGSSLTVKMQCKLQVFNPCSICQLTHG